MLARTHACTDTHARSHTHARTHARTHTHVFLQGLELGDLTAKPKRNSDAFFDPADLAIKVGRREQLVYNALIIVANPFSIHAAGRAGGL